MSLVLAPGEQIVKDWQYATSNGKNGNFSHCITVTDKRVVAHESAKNSSHHIELPLESVSAAELRYRKQINKRGIAIAIFGLIVLIAGILMLDNKPIGTILSIIGGCAIIIGIIMVIFFSKAQLTVLIYSKTVTKDGVLGVYANSIPPVLKIKRNKAVKVKVNPQVANEIVSTLGALILVK